MFYDQGWFQNYGPIWTFNLQIDVLLFSSLMPHFQQTSFWLARFKLLEYFKNHPLPDNTSSEALTTLIFNQIVQTEGFHLNGLTPHEVMSVIERDVVLYRTLTAQTEQEFASILAETKNNWTTKQKLLLTQMLGGRMVRLYDDERAQR